MYIAQKKMDRNEKQNGNRTLKHKETQTQNKSNSGKENTKHNQKLATALDECSTRGWRIT